VSIHAEEVIILLLVMINHYNRLIYINHNTNHNKLPEVVRNASVDNFKINIKKFLLKKAYYSFEDFLRDTIDTLN
jgi:hypothetical protein